MTADRAATTATAAEVIGRAALGHRGQWSTDGGGELVILPHDREEAAAVLSVMQVHTVHDWDSPSGVRWRDRRGMTPGGLLVRVATTPGETDPDPAPAGRPVPAEIRTEWVAHAEHAEDGHHAVYADGVHVGDHLYDGEAVTPDGRRLGRHLTVTAAARALAAASGDHGTG